MADLIDREEFYKRMRHAVSVAEEKELDGIVKILVGLVIPHLLTMPTVDAEPVRHGKWECLAENSTGLIYRCSNCTSLYNPNSKDVALGRLVEKPHYCPHCGAEMEGE